MLSLYTELSNVNKGRLNKLLVTITIKDIYGLSRGVTTLVYTPQLTPQSFWVDTLVVLKLDTGTDFFLVLALVII